MTVVWIAWRGNIGQKEHTIKQCLVHIGCFLMHSFGSEGQNELFYHTLPDLHIWVHASLSTYISASKVADFTGIVTAYTSCCSQLTQAVNEHKLFAAYTSCCSQKLISRASQYIYEEKVGWLQQFFYYATPVRKLHFYAWNSLSPGQHSKGTGWTYLSHGRFWRRAFLAPLIIFCVFLIRVVGPPLSLIKGFEVPHIIADTNLLLLHL